MDKNDIKKFYAQYADEIGVKRAKSPYPIRTYSHWTNWDSIVKYIKSGEKMLEVGCGEGIVSVVAAKKGVEVIATDISEPNLATARRAAIESGVNIKILSVDLENLPFADNSFDVVIADNVLEHLPNFKRGLAEIRRVTKNRAIIALPTNLNLCAWCLLGGDDYWRLSKKSFFAIFIGFVRFLINIFGEGVNEGYAGKNELPHLWRYPWIMRKELEAARFKIVAFEASSLCLPYFNFLLPLAKWMDKYKDRPILRDLGCGSIAVVEKNLS
jgi:ubiquinone/menaquinone biosynthesis C-methylase UbiE